jgi:hypothetical protein
MHLYSAKENSMPHILDKLKSPQPTLCVSLIENSVEIAKAVEAAGADGIKLHTNLLHRITGLVIPDLERERDRLQTIIDAVNVPVGIVPRGRAGTSPEEVSQLRDMGFDFVDLYAKFTHPDMLRVSGIAKWLGPTPDYTPDMIAILGRLPEVDVIEGSFLPVETFGDALSIDDIIRIKVVLKALEGSGTPLVIPTDRKLTTGDLPMLIDNGVVNYLIGYAVTGTSVESIAHATESFRQALDIAAG